jgi:predicted ester cyclase
LKVILAEALLKAVLRQGRAAWDPQFINEFFKAFPDWHTTIEHIVAENNLVVVFLNGSGTHKGEFHGIPPTNKLVNIRSSELYKIVNGRISGHWYVFDQLNLLTQTGVSL